MKLDQFELDPLVIVKPVQPARLQGGNMHEDVDRAEVRLDEAEPLLPIEPLYRTLCQRASNPKR
jgi:hypothetical protein